MTNENFSILDDESYDEMVIRIEEDEAIYLPNIYQGKKENDPFAAKLQTELESLKRGNLGGNSPLAMSIDSEQSPKGLTVGYKKLTYEEVESSLNKFFSKEFRIASEIDILLTYLKGQQHIFALASWVTLKKYNMLMFPALFITGGIALLGPFFDAVKWSGWVLSSLNAFLTVIIAINNFMKWQAIAEVFLNISNQYEFLAISVEMSRNQLFLDDEEAKKRATYDKLKDIESRIMDIKYNVKNMVIPYEVRINNPIISHINIFSFIQKIEAYQKNLILKYKDAKNEIRFIMYKWEKETIETTSDANEFRKQTEVKRLEQLMKEKDGLRKEILQNNPNTVYSYIDGLFTREIQNSEKYHSLNGIWMLLTCSQPRLELNGNPLVDNYLKFIFAHGDDC